MATSSDEVLEAILASIRSDLRAVSFLDLSATKTAAAWVEHNVPDACSIEPYDLVVSEATQFLHALSVSAPTSLLLVQRPVGTKFDRALAGPGSELSKISRVCTGDVEWVLFAKQPATSQKAVQISVVVPCQDQARPLWRLLTALAGDDETPSWELIVSDRGSFDETSSLLDAVEGSIEVISLTRQATLDEAITVGIERARSDLVAVVDPQVVPTVGWLRAMYDAFLDEPLACYCGGKILSRNDRGEVHEDWDSFRLFGLRLSRWRPDAPGGLAAKLSALATVPDAKITAPGVEGRLLS
ncbi:MAG: glycosyltransferase family 2 protein [Nannocystaceae bacterium]